MLPVLEEKTSPSERFWVGIVSFRHSSYGGTSRLHCFSRNKKYHESVGLKPVCQL